MLKQWFKQRTRWVKGNLYVLKSNFKYAFDPKAGRMRLDVVYYALVYLLMFTSLVFSDMIFMLGIPGFWYVTLGGFSSLLWEMAILLFVLNVAITLSVEKNEFNFSNLVLTFFMLFTYAKLWVLVVLNGIIQGVKDAVYQREVGWDKTERFEEAGVKKKGSKSKETEK